MLKVESIRDGVVIDHITAGRGMELYRLLHLEGQQQPVALLQYVRSEKIRPERPDQDRGAPAARPAGHPGVSGPSDHPDRDPGGAGGQEIPPHPAQGAEKRGAVPQPPVHHQPGAGLRADFRLSPGGKYRCIYCNQEISVKNSADFVL